MALALLIELVEGGMSYVVEKVCVEQPMVGLDAFVCY